MRGFILGLVAIALGGLVPAWWAGRDLIRALFLLMPAGLAVCGVAAALELLLPGSFVTWWAATSAISALVCGARSRSRGSGVGPLLPALAVLVGASGPVMELASFHLGWDSRSIWFLHARLLAGGHADLVAGLTSPGLLFSHPDYPLAGPGAVALAWNLGPHLDYRTAQVVIGALTVAATAALAYEIARLGRGRIGLAVSTLVGILVLVASYGPFGPVASNGYQDPLWSALACAAVVAGLIAPIEASSYRTACVFATAAALTKSEGLVAAVVIVLLTVVRYRTAGKRKTLRELMRPGRDLLVPAGTAFAIGIWIIAKRFHHIPSRYQVGSGVGRLLTGDPALTARFRPMWAAIWTQIRPLTAVAIVLAFAAISLRKPRHDLGLGGQSWTLLVFAATLGALIPAYLFDGSDINWLIYTSIQRTTIFPYLLLLTAVGIWPIAVSGAIPSQPPKRKLTSNEAVDPGTCLQRSGNVGEISESGS